MILIALLLGERGEAAQARDAWRLALQQPRIAGNRLHRLLAAPDIEVALAALPDADATASAGAQQSASRDAARSLLASLPACGWTMHAVSR
jgi:hypothetical protein